MVSEPISEQHYLREKKKEKKKRTKRQRTEPEQSKTSAPTKAGKNSEVDYESVVVIFNLPVEHHTTIRCHLFNDISILPTQMDPLRYFDGIFT